MQACNFVWGLLASAGVCQCLKPYYVISPYLAGFDRIGFQSRNSDPCLQRQAHGLRAFPLGSEPQMPFELYFIRNERHFELEKRGRRATRL